MSQPAMNYDSAEALRASYQLLKDQQPGIRARNAAQELGVSEGELLAAHVGNNATRLVDDAETILRSILPLGQVMALTRNEHCVHERKGVYDNCEFFRHGKMNMGMFVNPDIDLRLFMGHWRYNFAVCELSRAGERKSLQFFDKSGTAIHKVYLTNKSDPVAYERLVEQHRHAEQDNHIDIEAYPAPAADLPDTEIDWAGLRAAWEGLQDTHDFHFMLRRFQVGREQAFARIGADLAYQVGNNSVRSALEAARDSACEIMAFVGNRGCIQIHSGPVHKLVEYGEWYNVLDPLFNLHLRSPDIARCWVSKKPTVDGQVSALEVFSASGELIITLFGKRKPGIPELPAWRAIVDSIPPLTTDHVS